ncbi:MAG: hypothetical protein ACRBDI_03160 [Alphaproteobacteria bacterium]
MAIPAFIWGATKLTALFYGASALDDNFASGNVKKAGKWGLSEGFGSVAGWLGFERSKPDATGVQINGMPGSASGNGGANTQFNQSSTNKPSGNNATLDTTTGEVKLDGSGHLSQAFEKFKDGDIMGAGMSLLNSLTSDKNGERDFFNMKTMTMATTLFGGLFAAKNMLGGKGPNSGAMAPLLLIATVIGGVVLGGGKLMDMMDEAPTHDNLSNDRDINVNDTDQQQPRYQSIEELTM